MSNNINAEQNELRSSNIESKRMRISKNVIDIGQEPTKRQKVD